MTKIQNYKPVLGHWILSFGIYLYFGACILVFGIILGGRASPDCMNFAAQRNPRNDFLFIILM